jgi:hypothetical protein
MRAIVFIFLPMRWFVLLKSIQGVLTLNCSFFGDACRRKKQIQTLTQYFQNVTETVQGSKYEIISDVPVAGGNTMMASAVQSTYPFTQPQRPSPAAPLRPLLIIVELPSDFPSKPPRILVPNERHRFGVASFNDATFPLSITANLTICIDLSTLFHTF